MQLAETSVCVILILCKLRSFYAELLVHLLWFSLDCSMRMSLSWVCAICQDYVFCHLVMCYSPSEYVGCRGVPVAAASNSRYLRRDRSECRQATRSHKNWWRWRTVLCRRLRYNRRTVHLLIDSVVQWPYITSIEQKCFHVGLSSKRVLSQSPRVLRKSSETDAKCFKSTLDLIVHLWAFMSKS